MNASMFPPEIADIISGIIIYLCAFSLLFRSMFRNLLSGSRKDKVKKKQTPQVTDTPANGPAAADGKESE